MKIQLSTTLLILFLTNFSALAQLPKAGSPAAAGHDSSGGDQPLGANEFVCQTESPVNGYRVEIARQLKVNQNVQINFFYVGDDSLRQIKSVTESKPMALAFSSPAFLIRYFFNDGTIFEIEIEERKTLGVYPAHLMNFGADKELPDSINFICQHN